jgi:hypothetical protein
MQTMEASLQQVQLCTDILAAETLLLLEHPVLAAALVRIIMLMTLAVLAPTKAGRAVVLVGL